MKVLNGGPMGRAMSNLASPVVKGCSGITVLEGAAAPAWSGELLYQMRQMRVGLPDGIGALSDGQTLAPQAVGAARGGVGDQLHRKCGCCQFTCPADIPLLDFIRMGENRRSGR